MPATLRFEDSISIRFLVGSRNCRIHGAYSPGIAPKMACDRLGNRWFLCYAKNFGYHRSMLRVCARVSEVLADFWARWIDSMKWLRRQPRQW